MAGFSICGPEVTQLKGMDSMTKAEEVRQTIAQGRATLESGWVTAWAAHQRYREQLQLSDWDVFYLERATPHGQALMVEVGGETFAIFARTAAREYISGAPYSSGMYILLMARCESRPDLNIVVGGGPSELVFLPPEWEAKVLAALKA